MLRKSYLVAYDLSNPSSRRKALRLVQPNRLGGQYSVHECCLSYPEAQELFAALSDLVEAPTALIDHSSDDLRSYRIPSPGNLWLAGDTPKIDTNGTAFADGRRSRQHGFISKPPQ